MRRFAFALVAVAPACSLLIDVDRFDEGGPLGDDAATETHDHHAELNRDVTPPPEAGDPDVVTTCTESNVCKALMSCCEYAFDNDLDDFGTCYDRYDVATPHADRCCTVLLDERSQHKCP